MSQNQVCMWTTICLTVTADVVPQTYGNADKRVLSRVGAAALRKMATHPSTAVMVQEALKELDSRKGVSSQAIQNYIKQKYPSVDLVRLKHLVRNALKKGMENGTLVRPANATVTTGAVGKFRVRLGIFTCLQMDDLMSLMVLSRLKLAPKVKESKPKSENADPNVPKAPKAAKEGAKKPKKTGKRGKMSPTDVKGSDPLH